MSKLNIREIFKSSILKIDLMLNKLDTQLGVNSNNNNNNNNNESNNKENSLANNNSNNEINNNNNNNNNNEDNKKKEIKKQNKKEEKNVNVKINNNNNTDSTKNNSEENKKNEEILNLFNECDLRVGKIIDLKYMENSDKVYLLKIDVGEAEPREIGTGLRKYVKEEDLLNHKCIVFANLKPKKLGGKAYLFFFYFFLNFFLIFFLNFYFLLYLRLLFKWNGYVMYRGK
jgi:tRNA-binding EMAP/Myf-like protein